MLAVEKRVGTLSWFATREKRRSNYRAARRRGISVTATSLARASAIVYVYLAEATHTGASEFEWHSPEKGARHELLLFLSPRCRRDDRRRETDRWSKRVTDEAPNSIVRALGARLERRVA